MTIEDVEDDIESDEVTTIKDDFDIDDFNKKKCTDQLTIERFKK